ncbi:trypsin-like cysteine/serine peptidase domain-containing protein [Rostrohypoxylon terebratum]|nr:trypsin-like cysteine/serine peptidase domain-containing protein [Rostrohypoxylon terebratum]
MSEPFRESPFKVALVSAHRDSPASIGLLKEFFLEYQSSVLTIMNMLMINIHHEDLDNELREKLGSTYDALISYASHIESRLCLLAKATFIKGDHLPFSTPESTPLQSLHDTIVAQCLDSEPVLECHLRPRRMKEIMKGLDHGLCRLYNALYLFFWGQVSTEVALWNLEVGTAHTTERYLGVYLQEEEPQGNIMLGGKHRCICKITITDQDGKTSSGTGFLVNDTTVVTVAHNVFHANIFAAGIKVYIGFRGLKHASLELRWGKSVAINWEYYYNGDVAHDFAVIHLNEPFERVGEYIKYGSDSGCPEIAVVGYPCDIPQYGKGRYMYTSQGTRLGTRDGLLYYELDTAVGNSGSPVLELHKDGSFRAIGVHRGYQRNLNCAVMINHKSNIISAFECCFRIRRRGGGQRIHASQARVLWKISLGPTRGAT